MAYRSKIEIFGLPLICISGLEPAVGFIAIGQVAYGFFTLGQFGIGLIFGIGQFMGGLFSIAQFSLGMVMSVGQFAFGWYSIGMISIGFEGLHGVGYHYIQNNFLNFLVADWSVLVYLLIFLIIAGVQIYLINLMFNYAFTGIKNAVGKIFYEMKNGMSRTSGAIPVKKTEEYEPKKNTKFDLTVRVIFFMLSIIVIFGIFKSLNIDKAFDMARYNRILKTGVKGIGQVLEIKNMNITINKHPVIMLKLKVYPKSESELQPFEVNITVLVQQNRIPEKGEKLQVRYDEKNPKEVIWALE